MIDRRSFVIGDVHGEVNKLREALAEATELSCQIILVGDYINRGPSSKEVLELLFEAKKSMGKRLTMIRGNHEVAILEYLLTGDASKFLAHGGLTTVRSYYPDPPHDVLDAFRRNYPSSHLALLMETVPYFEDRQTLVSHCGINPQDPKSRSLPDMCLGSFPSIFSEPSPAASEKLVVCGHYVQRTGRPYVSAKLICLDTGCGTDPDAPLTAVLLPDRTFYSYR
jgi:serine/threonine protein phosphatase 1